MKVLVACEFSGIVREAFAARGHDAWSCDLLDTEIPGQHVKGDVLDILEIGWDLMIAHPPCTYLASANSYNFWQNADRRMQAFEFVGHLINAPIDKICIENPRGALGKRLKMLDKYKYRYSGTNGVVAQKVNPWQFGHNETKETWLYLWGLPKLQMNEQLVMPEDNRKANLSVRSGSNKIPPQVKDRWKIRSRTYTGIAKAMAEQWG